MNGESIKSCSILAAQFDGADVTTIEGIANGDELHPMQQTFHENHGLQCGFCTPGMVMSMICVTHELNFAKRVAHRIIFMDEGHIFEEQPPTDFFCKPENRLGKVVFKPDPGSLDRITIDRRTMYKSTLARLAV